MEKTFFETLIFKCAYFDTKCTTCLNNVASGAIAETKGVEEGESSNSLTT